MLIFCTIKESEPDHFAFTEPDPDMEPYQNEADLEHCFNPHASDPRCSAGVGSEGSGSYPNVRHRNIQTRMTQQETNYNFFHSHATVDDIKNLMNTNFSIWATSF
jgi:hypothetical protein